MLLSLASNSYKSILDRSVINNVTHSGYRPNLANIGNYVWNGILTGNEFGVALAKQQPKRNGTHDEVGEVFIEWDFLLHGRQGVGDAESMNEIYKMYDLYT